MSKNCFWTTDCGNGLQTFSFIVKGQRTKVESFFDNRLSKTTSPNDYEYFSFEPELRIFETANSRNSFDWQKSNGYRPDCCLLSVVLQSKQPATAQKSVVRSLLSVVLQPPNQLPTKSPLSVVRCLLSSKNKTVFARVSER